MVLVLMLTLAAAPAQAYDPAYEARNYAKINERAATDYTPQFQAQLAARGLSNERQAAQILAQDGPAREYGRAFSGNLCSNKMNGCAGDVRLYDWGANGYGIVRPILFTARNGSTLSGHVWITAAGPAKRPGVVITNGSVQAPEELYWFAAETLAKAGYVVMTWEPQGQGYSDTFGAGVDRSDGVPSQTGQPFYDGTEDALDFFFSAPGSPYAPRKSCSSGTSHADKQSARVADGRASAYNPLFGSLDSSSVGLVGHSLGAAAASYVGQLDPRVHAVVALDNLNNVAQPSSAFAFGPAIKCASGSSPRPATVPITKPALGMSADYYLTPMPYTADPDAATIQSKHGGSLGASAAGVDTGQIMVRGGTHYEFSYIPNPGFGATRRGIDMVSWYTTAFLDKELRADPSADARLLTTRWRSDRFEGAVDDQLPPDANLYSSYFRSRMDIARAAPNGRFTCEDLRVGCAGQSTADGRPPDYSFLAAAGYPDTHSTPGSTTAPAGADGVSPAASGAAALAAIAAANSNSSRSSSSPTPSDRCAEGAPRSRIARVRSRRRSIAIRGSAAEAGNCRRSIVSVLVAIALERGHRCRFLLASGSFGRRVNCRRTRYLRASGTARWILRARVKLSAGRYKIYSRSVDSGGRIERKRLRGNFRRLRVRY